MSHPSLNPGKTKYAHSSKADLLDGRLAAMLQRDRPLRLLLMAATADRPKMPELPSGRWVELRKGSADTPVRCRNDALPFGDEVFDLVIVSDVLRDGDEPELPEAERVLKSGGILLICGKGRFNRSKDLPLVNVRKLCARLNQHDFDVQGCDSIGLLGRNTVTGKRWLKPLAGWSHSVLLRARHHDNTPAVTPLRFSRPRAGVRTALDSVSREAVQG